MKRYLLEPKPYLLKLTKECAELESMGFELIGLHSSGEMLDANEAFLKELGYSIEELQGMNAWRFFDVQSIERIMEKLKVASEDPYDVIARRKDSSMFDVTIIGRNVEIEDVPCRIVGAKLRS